ncbi:MAG: Transposase for insertion sequence element IS4351 [Candidatus Nomurabacteria bacterium GW2011_GWA1_46_11]|uniref:Transposase for insertion sequence element IS4351 n=1 Tax=Candidatus Nomurabacteria bacterium GW2011_GWA1_46_11 TaxID=1618732 RepID=A0A0G1RL79_9BACT|nr:MAG: Transposase for insertion sequence element IS4351 [Microgenomates group bacterium GW2011_GWB1_44_8]KKU21675.1 MAG: Transposase for insertion sequence element IS4351 [Candidatus Nomurabacteria bacterium GW2011_GWA1_46_11]
MTHHKLSETERDLLAIWKAQGTSNKECARRLSRHPSTIGRELTRNRLNEERYVAIYAQTKAQSREKQVAYSKPQLKNSDIFTYVTGHLEMGWSPDQISGRLGYEHPGDDHWQITAETIYRWIYQPKQMKGKHPWYEYLRRKQKRRVKYQGRKAHSSQIPDRVSISQRGTLANLRLEFGNWEGDTVEGLAHRNGVHTEAERMSRKILAAKIDSITSIQTTTVQEQLFARYPPFARKSTTLDNGKENHQHTRLHQLSMKTYFAHPYSSFERGTNEHGNWHLRYYFPKGTDFTTVSEEELQDVVEEINNRPRKILGYKTANERFTELLTGVAIDY